MTSIGDVSGASAAAGSTPTRTTGNQLGKDDFLKLLVAQLKYQDPSKPADSTQFLAQTAQFTMVEKIEDMAKTQTSLLTAQLQLGASNLVGRTVTYTDTNGVQQTGKVSAATISGSSPTLRVGNTDVPLSSVTEVRSTTA